MGHYYVLSASCFALGFNHASVIIDRGRAKQEYESTLSNLKESGFDFSVSLVEHKTELVYSSSL